MRFDNRQDALALHFSIQIDEGQTASNALSSEYIVGTLRTFAFVPNPFFYNALIPADGTIVSFGDAERYGLDIANTFGEPSQEGGVALANLTGRMAIGQGSVDGHGGNRIGEVTGADFVEITDANRPVSVGGSGQPIDNHQVSLAVTYAINVGGTFPARGGKQINVEPMIGQIAAFAVGPEDLPTGWLPADGRELSFSDNMALFSIIGTRYGEGPSPADFKLPDLGGRAPVGGENAGKVVGTADIVLTKSQLATQDGGSGADIDNVQPGLTLTPLIVIDSVFPSGGFSDETITQGEVIWFAGGYVPKGFAVADGSLLFIEENYWPYTLIGNVYGGDARKGTFALPDLMDRAALGASGESDIGAVAGRNTATLDETALPEPPSIARDDVFVAPAGGTIVGDVSQNDGGSGLDLVVTGIGSGGNVGSPSILASGARLSMNADGTFHYDPNGAFDGLNPGDITTDIFTYTVVDTAARSRSSSKTEDAQVVVVIEAPADRIDGGGSDDRLGGTQFANVLTACGGDDAVFAGAGDDTVLGGSGHDRLAGSAGRDDISGGPGVDTLGGGRGEDTLSGGRGDDHLFGGVGADALDGGGASDKLVGGSGNDGLDGGGGHDSLSGGLGHDHAEGGAGNDLVRGHAGDDYLGGGRGDDRLLGHLGDDTVSGGTGDDLLRGGSGADVLIGDDGNDTLLGEAGPDLLGGGRGNDRLKGGNGADTLAGGDGEDVLFGGAGEDVILAGPGRDIAFLGAGADTAVIDVDSGVLVVTDFVVGEDRLMFVGRDRDDIVLLGSEILDSNDGSLIVRIDSIDLTKLNESDVLFV
ncbi:MAG: tail fiber protein [Devosia sp.]